jgi:hypothetical protein
MSNRTTRTRGNRKNVNNRPVTKGQVKQMIKSVVNAESHFWVTVLSSGVSTTPTLVPLFEPPQNTTDIGRIGDSVHVDSLEMRSVCYTGDATNYLRVVLFQWNDRVAGAATPVATDVLLDVSNPYVSTYNQDTLDAGALHVLADRTFSMSTAANPNTSWYQEFKSGFRRLVQFEGASTTGFSKFFLLQVSDSVAVTHPTFYATVTIHFKDV